MCLTIKNQRSVIMFFWVNDLQDLQNLHDMQDIFSRRVSRMKNAELRRVFSFKRPFVPSSLRPFIPSSFHPFVPSSPSRPNALMP